MAEFEVLAVSPKDADAAEKFAKSLRETGFAVIKDHDIDMSEIQAMYDTWSGYFAGDSKSADATPAAMAEAVARVVAQGPRKTEGLLMDGATRSVDIVEQLKRERAV